LFCIRAGVWIVNDREQRDYAFLHKSDWSGIKTDMSGYPIEKDFLYYIQGGLN